MYENARARIYAGGADPVEITNARNANAIINILPRKARRNRDETDRKPPPLVRFRSFIHRLGETPSESAPTPTVLSRTPSAARARTCELRLRALLKANRRFNFRSDFRSDPLMFRLLFDARQRTLNGLPFQGNSRIGFEWNSLRRYCCQLQKAAKSEMGQSYVANQSAHGAP